jgi:hypothetical protein
VNGTIRDKTVRLDSCLRAKVEALNRRGIVTVGSCCGHNRYPETILVRDRTGRIRVLGTRIIVLRTRNFYRKDKHGVYYIPEAIQ